MIKMIKAIPFFIITALFGLQASALEVGDAAPCVVLDGQSANGSAVTGCIRDTIEPGQNHTIIDFFSIDCGTCKANMPALSALANEISQLATTRYVSIDRDVNRVKAFLKDSEYAKFLKFPVAFDFERDAKTAYGVVKTPTMFILDKEYNIVYKHSGALSAASIQEIKKVVGAKGTNNELEN